MRFSLLEKKSPPSDEGTKGALYKLKSLCALSEGKKIRSQEGTNSNFSKCMRQLPHASDKSFCDWIKILSFLLGVDQIPILDIIEFQFSLYGRKFTAERDESAPLHRLS